MRKSSKTILENKKRKLLKKMFKSENVKKNKLKYNSDYCRNNTALTFDKKKSLKINTQLSIVLELDKFVTVNKLSNIMGVIPSKIRGYCLSLGITLSSKDKLNLELLMLVSYEFGFILKIIKEYLRYPDNLFPKPPIVTIIGHVDHGKTSLLDYIRRTNLVERELGGITQYINAYNIKYKEGRSITFIDTPGHEAFISMRFRVINITDIIIIVIDTGDNIMSQTIEIISYANTLSIPIIFALNKIDKKTAQPNKIRKQLANINILLEDWGGRFQSQEISAKTGIGIEQLLEKVWLEAEVLGLMSNSYNPTFGTVIDSTIDKRKGYITNILIQNGILKRGNYISSGIYYGKIKAIYNEFNKFIHEAGPSEPVFILGLNGPPAAGERFKIFVDEKGAKKNSLKRKQFQREQNLKIKKLITLDEIGRRIALTHFNEMNIILKGDVNGSIDVLTNIIQNISISNEEISLKIIHKGIGLISESDVILASVSNAIIIGFNVKCTTNAKIISENKNINIRIYSIIYDVIDDLTLIIKKIISPLENEQIIGKAEIRHIYNIKKLHIIAGCMVTDGKICRHLKIKLFREGVFIQKGEITSLKRFKEDVKEVTKGYECGLIIKGFSDIKIGDLLEIYEKKI